MMSTYFALALTLLRYLSVSAQIPAFPDFEVLGIRINKFEEFDPTIFTITCGPTYYKVDSLVNLEVSHYPDQPPESSKRQIAFSGRSYVLKPGLVNPDVAKPGLGAIGLPTPLTVSYGSGTCEDTGLYQCKEVYRPTTEGNYMVNISEARVPACLPGAIATLETFMNSTFVRTKFVCRVNASLVRELLSLEISVVSQGSRHLLAYINSFLNDAKLSYPGKKAQAEGEIYPFNPAASSLNVTIDVTSFLEVSQHTTTCTAVYLDKNAGANNVVSMADLKVWFQN